MFYYLIEVVNSIVLHVVDILKMKNHYTNTNYAKFIKRSINTSFNTHIIILIELRQQQNLSIHKKNQKKQLEWHMNNLFFSYVIIICNCFVTMCFFLRYKCINIHLQLSSNKNIIIYKILNLIVKTNKIYVIFKNKSKITYRRFQNSQLKWKRIGYLIISCLKIQSYKF